MSTLPLELGQVADPYARRALEQISLRWPAGGRPPLAGCYSSATHPAGMTLSVPSSVHGLRASRELLVQAYDVATGAMVIPDLRVATNGDVTLTFTSAVAADSVRIVIHGPLA